MATATAPGTTFKTVTARQIADAANQTHVPNFIIAGVYKTGYVGDPLQLAKTLEYWYGAGGGGTSWQRALASWHAGTPSGAVNKTDLAFGSKVLKNAENLPRNLQGALDTGSALTIAAIIAGGFALGGAAAGSAAGEAAAGGGAAAAGGGATAGAGAAGGGAGAAATKIASKVASSAASIAPKVLGGVAITALLTETGLWKGVAMVIAGAVLAFLALRQVAGAAA